MSSNSKERTRPYSPSTNGRISFGGPSKRLKIPTWKWSPASSSVRPTSTAGSSKRGGGNGLETGRSALRTGPTGQALAQTQDQRHGGSVRDRLKPGSPEKGHAHLVGALEFSVRKPDGATEPIAWVCGLSDEERQGMTQAGPEGQVLLNPRFLGRRATITGKERSPKSGRIHHARIQCWLN